MLATTVGITAVVAVAVLAWSLLRGGDDGPGPGDVSWDRIAVIDRTTGAVTTFDRDGEQTAQRPATTRVRDVHVHGGHLALVGTDAIVLTDPSSDDPPTAVEIPARSVVEPIETPTTMHLLVGEPAGGNLLIVDVDDGSVVDVGAAASPTVPKLFVETVRVSQDGTAFAVADAANFQTIVVGEAIDGAVFLADQPVAVGEELIATSQVVNLQADVSLVTLERRTEATAPTELPRGGILVEDELVMVSVDGGVFRVGRGDQEAERIGQLALPSGGTVDWAVPSLVGERLVVGGTGFQAVVDLEGNVIFATTFAGPVEPLRANPSWRCLPVGSEDTGHSIVALDSGELRADLTGRSIVAVSADGCTVIGGRAGAYELVNAEGTVPLGVARSVALSPDGQAVVRTTTTGRTELVAVSDDLELADPIELVGVPTNQSVAFLRD